MSRIKNCILALLVAVPSAAVSQPAAVKSPVTFTCTIYQHAQPVVTGDEGVGSVRRASSQMIQFNVNKPALPGTVGVDRGHRGHCDAKVPAGYELRRMWAEMHKGSSNTENIGPGEDRTLVESSIVLKSVVMSVNHHRLIGEIVGNYKGNVFYTFFAEYRRSSPPN